MIPGRRYLCTVSLLVFIMEFTRTYKIRTRYCLRTDDTHKSWITEGLINLPLNYASISISDCSGRSTRKYISSYLINPVISSYSFLFYPILPLLTQALLSQSLFCQESLFVSKGFPAHATPLHTHAQASSFDMDCVIIQ